MASSCVFGIRALLANNVFRCSQCLMVPHAREACVKTVFLQVQDSCQVARHFPDKEKGKSEGSQRCDPGVCEPRHNFGMAGQVDHRN
jgi:hypothetical protein